MYNKRKTKEIFNMIEKIFPDRISLTLPTVFGEELTFLEFCGKDYDRLVRMMERTLSYQNLMELVQSIREVDVGSLSEVTEKIRGMKDEIDPEVIKNIADIARMNDPALGNLKDTIDNEAVDKAFEEKTDEKPN